MHKCRTKVPVRLNAHRIHHLLLHVWPADLVPWSGNTVTSLRVVQWVKRIQPHKLLTKRRHPHTDNLQLVANAQHVGARHLNAACTVSNRGAAKQRCVGPIGRDGPPLQAHKGIPELGHVIAAHGQLRRKVAHHGVAVVVHHGPARRDLLPVDLQRGIAHLLFFDALGLHVAGVQAHIGQLNAWRRDGIARLERNFSNALGHKGIPQHPAFNRANVFVLA